MKTGKIKDLYDKVKAMLEADVKCRDSEVLVWLKFKNDYLRSHGIDPKTISSYNVDMMELDGKLPNRKSIERCWRLVQEREISLRGSTWAARHNKQKEVLQDIEEVTKMHHAPSFFS